MDIRNSPRAPTDWHHFSLIMHGLILVKSGWSPRVCWLTSTLLLWLTSRLFTGAPGVVASPLPQPRSTHRIAPQSTQHIVGFFNVSNFNATSTVFNSTLTDINRNPHHHVILQGLSLPPQPDPQANLVYICDAVTHHNVTTFLAIGTQKVLNVLSIVNQYVGIPIVAYNTDTHQVQVKVSSYNIFLNVLRVARLSTTYTNSTFIDQTG